MGDGWRSSQTWIVFETFLLKQAWPKVIHSNLSALDNNMMIIKAKLLSILTGLRKCFFPTQDESYEQAMKAIDKQPGWLGKAFIAIYFPSLNENEDKKSTLRRMLNRIILIASTSGILCLISKILDLHFLEGIFLMFCMSSLIPYIPYIVAKKQTHRQ